MAIFLQNVIFPFNFKFFVLAVCILFGSLGCRIKVMDWMGLALMKRISKDLLYPQFVAAKALQGLQSCLKALQLRQGTSSLDL
jgi:hypothetical protein